MEARSGGVLSLVVGLRVALVIANTAAAASTGLGGGALSTCITILAGESVAVPFVS